MQRFDFDHEQATEMAVALKHGAELRPRGSAWTKGDIVTAVGVLLAHLGARFLPDDDGPLEEIDPDQMVLRTREEITAIGFFGSLFAGRALEGRPKLPEAPSRAFVRKNEMTGVVELLSHPGRQVFGQVSIDYSGSE